MIISKQENVIVVKKESTTAIMMFVKVAQIDGESYKILRHCKMQNLLATPTMSCHYQL